MSFEDFRLKGLSAISEMRRSSTEDILLIHHDDADGLSSAAIVKATSEREDYKVRPLCLEKVYPEIIEDIHAKFEGIIIYADIGSSHADLISRYNKERNLTIILDHHDPTPSRDSKVYDLNLEHFGFRGEDEFSGATCCYLFSKLLKESNRDLSYLALVGSCEIPTGFKGLNRMVLDQAAEYGVVHIDGSHVRIASLRVDVQTLFSELQILGPVGYYEGGPDLGIKVCLEGIDDEAKGKIKELEERRKTVNKRLLAMLYRGFFKETEHIQWFDAGGLFRGMGSKVIGQFCSFLSYQKKLIKPNKYILGMMNQQNEVPGWGKIKGEFVKASVRAPQELQGLIKQGKSPNAVGLLVKATEGFGVADGHEYAANVIIPSDKKEALIKNAELTISTYISKN